MSPTWNHELPMRWADLDILNHVTNVVYLDYATEAQTVLRRDGLLPAELPMADVTVVYLRPTQLSSRPLLMRAGLDGDVLTQEVCTTGGAEPQVHARIVTTYGEPAPVTLPALDDPVAIRVRMSDLDVTGTASVAGRFRVAQEARILHFATRMERDRLGQFVVGTMSLQPLRSLTWDPELLDSHSWISRVGGGSFTIDTAVGPLDDPVFTTQTALVGFDADTQTARRFTDAEREHLHSHLR